MDSTLYARVTKLLSDLEAQEAREAGIVRDLESFAASRPKGTREQECALAALAVSRFQLAGTRKKLGLMRAARDAYLERVERDRAETQAFAVEWIVQHGITRGMPQGWNRGVR